VPAEKLLNNLRAVLVDNFHRQFST